MSQGLPSEAESDFPTPFERFVWRRKYWLTFLSFSISFILARLLAPAPIHEVRQSSVLTDVHAIGLAMYSYANDNDGKYPTGKSSTEIFQQLLDGGYVTDASLFYFRMKGKTPAAAQQKKLKPENVSWDVTDGLTRNDSNALPLIFLTGYKIDYVSGGKAHLLKNAIFPYGIAVFYKSNFSKFIVAQVDGTLIVFDTPFDPKGKTYRQLTPDGPLP